MSWYSRLVNRAIHAVGPRIQRAACIAPGTDLADSFGSFGVASLINYPVATLFGQGKIHIGTQTLIGAHSVLSVGHSPDDANAPDRGLVIGDRCVLGARTILTAHESIVIGDDVWFGQSIFVSDASHGYQDTDTPIGLQLGFADPVEIGSGSWIGHGAVILPGARIGRNVVIGAGSVVRGVIPDHSVAVGAPARVVRHLEPGRGWVSTSNPDDVRPAYTPEEYGRLLAGEDL